MVRKVDQTIKKCTKKKYFALIVLKTATHAKHHFAKNVPKSVVTVTGQCAKKKEEVNAPYNAIGAVRISARMIA